MKVMTTNHDMYCRLIRCIVLNSLTTIFENNADIPETIVHICLSAMSSKSTDVRDRVDEFNYIVKVYRVKILRDCQRYSEGGEDEMPKLETPKQETQATAFKYLDANRNKLVKPHCNTGRLPSMISTPALQEAARHILGIHCDYKSNDKYEKHMYWAVRGMAIKWWQSRITNDGNASNTSYNVKNTVNPPALQGCKSGEDQLPLKKRRYRVGPTDKGTRFSTENEPPSNHLQNNGKEPTEQVFWVRSDKHFRSLMRLQKKKYKKQMRQAM